MTKNKFLGSTLIIAGTALGGGMLALPLASAGLGFYTSAFLLFANWGLMTYTALLMLEIHQHADKDATLHFLAKNILGRPGQYLATFSSFFLTSEARTSEMTTGAAGQSRVPAGTRIVVPGRTLIT